MVNETSFFASAQKARSNFSCEKEWARHYAREYFHSVNSTPGFLPIYNRLLSTPVETPARVTRRTVSKPVFARPGQQTTAEEDLAKRQLNQVLHREYEAWYDAFKEEAAEAGEPASTNARWARHAARILSRRTGISAAELEPIAEAWLRRDE